MNSQNNDEFVSSVPSLKSADHRAELRKELMALHGPSSPRWPRWLRIAATVGTGCLLMGAGAAAKEAVDQVRGRNYTTTLWEVHLDSQGNVTERASEPQREQIAPNTEIVRGSGSTLSQVVISGGGPDFSREDADRKMQQIQAAINERKFRFIREDSPMGEKTYIYALELPTGETRFNTRIRLEDVKGWDDLQQKQKDLAIRQKQDLMQAVSQGKARITSDHLIIYHVCRDVSTGKTIEVLKTEPANAPAMATIFESPMAPNSPSERSTWQEHLDALAQGKRELLDAKAYPQFTYVYTTAGGNEQTQRTSWIRPSK